MQEWLTENRLIEFLMFLIDLPHFGLEATNLLPPNKWHFNSPMLEIELEHPTKNPLTREWSCNGRRDLILAQNYCMTVKSSKLRWSSKSAQFASARKYRIHLSFGIYPGVILRLKSIYKTRHGSVLWFMPPLIIILR